MKIDITPEQETWLASQVQAGLFASLDDAARAAIEAVMNEDAGLEADDCLWAKAGIGAAIAELDRGGGTPAEDVFAELRAKLKQLPG
jgi:Arc/MetJ-type ribon-helix-helix transcriptional regulator